MKNIIYGCCFFIVMQLVTACGTYADHPELPYRSYYDMTKPDQVISLPDELLEVSGLSAVAAHQLACVQDEKGVIFFYDLQDKKVREQITFGPDGDYEGITRADSTWLVLRSDGLLFEINAHGEKPVVKTHTLDVSTKDHEGLYYDSTTNSLFMAAKSSWKKEQTEEDIRVIYRFDRSTYQLREESFLFIYRKDIYEFASKNDIPIPQRINKKGKVKKGGASFKPSAIALHPVTGHLFILSASDQGLLIVDRQGNIQDYFPLDPALFNKPEGIAFTENGDMYMANEGEKDGSKKPALLFFTWHGEDQ